MVRLGPTSRGEIEVHEPTVDCGNVHCYSCGLDEPSDRFDYRVCFECGHVVRSARDLVRAYRRVSLASIDRSMPWLRGNEFWPSILEVLWRVWRIRAEQITFCQECLHDF